ncbi:Leader peptidase PppA [Rubripirellula obstinata]|uniref:Leader peptidase PppA n=1 Tax=Rubripirellula obstinata TaxID=406547 RepID=A0A5B1CEP9_9BACT|nr:A24 family peptidase [Rubripirellula obstinata]KAA1258345.1 Leader peptidase PppA [Rubripirellula obstinata]
MKRLRHLRPAFPFLAACFGLLAAIGLYVIGLAWVQASGSSLFSPADLFVPRLIDVTVVLWCFWIGSSIGSFLNVVAWRMPRGESINGRSHCPRCLAKLRAIDNFPVFGWLRLGGRCRTCHLPISSRYPIVELAVGLSMTLVAVGELYQISLPGMTVYGFGGPLWAPRISTDVLVMLTFHVYAVTIAWAFALVRFDDQRLPARLVVWGLVPLIIAMLVLPGLGITSWRAAAGTGLPAKGLTTLELTGTSLYVDGFLRVLTALVAAAILGRSLARGLCPTADPKMNPLGKSTAELMDVIAILAVPSLVFGWQTVIAVVVVASVLAAILKRTFLSSTKPLGCFAIAICVSSAIQLLFWNRLNGFQYWPSPSSTPMVILGWSAMILLIPIWLGGPANRVRINVADSEIDSENDSET